MEFQEQEIKLPVGNFDELVEQNKNVKKRHGKLLPNSVRAVFCGPSNSGKTNALLALIIHPNGLRFQNIYVYSKSLNQPKYKFLEKILKNIPGIGYFPFNQHEEVIEPQAAKPYSLMIFDDVSTESQSNIRAFFCMGRHQKVDCFYLSQTYTSIPKHLVRDNTNFLIIFRQNEKNLKHIYDDHVNTDMDFFKFRNICSACWSEDNYIFS